MSNLKKVGFLFAVLLIVAAVSFFVADVQAIVPEIQEVVFWSNGDNTMLNVTFYHTPITAFHYTDQIEVDTDGTVSSYDISQSSVTTIAIINLGEISGNPEARVRVHCTIDGWSGWSSQQSIPELSLWITIPLCFIGTLILIGVRKRFFEKG